MGGVGSHRHAHGLGVGRTEKVAPAMEPSIEFRPRGRTLTGKSVHFRPDTGAQVNQGSRQSVELILQPGAASRAGLQTTMEAVQKGTNPAVIRIQPFVPIRCWEARLNLIELSPRGSRDGISDVLYKAPLEEQRQGFCGRGPLEFQGVLLPMIQNQKGTLSYQVPPLRRCIERRSTHDGLERQSRAVLLNMVALRDPIQEGRAVRQLPRGWIKAELKGAHVQFP